VLIRVEAIRQPLEELPLGGPTPRQFAEAYASAALMKATYLVALFGIAATSITFAVLNVGSVRDFNRRILHWTKDWTKGTNRIEQKQEDNGK